MDHVVFSSLETTNPFAFDEQVTKIWHQKGNTYVLPRLNSNFIGSLIEKPLRQGLKPLQVWPHLMVCACMCCKCVQCARLQKR